MDYNECPMEAYTAYSYEEMKALQVYSGKSGRVPIAILLVFWLLYMAFAVFSAIVWRASLSVFPIVITVFLVFLFLAQHGVFYTRAADAVNARHLRGGETFLFRERDFSIHAEQPEYRCTVDLRYDFLYKFAETKDMFYLYLNPRLVYMVDKQGFRTGSPDELRRLLASHVVDRTPKAQKSVKNFIWVFLILLLVVTVMTFLFVYFDI